MESVCFENDSLGPFIAGCYLLRSLNPQANRFGGRTYIGFTVNPERRVKQHNGILTQGAYRTKKWRPWEMVMLVTGFADQRTALQFEWTWQHLDTSLDTKEAVMKIKVLISECFSQKKRRDMKIHGVVGQVLNLFVLLSTPPWKYFPLKLRCMSGQVWRQFGDVVETILNSSYYRMFHTQLGDFLLRLPEHMEVSVGPLSDFMAKFSQASLVEDEAKDHQEDSEACYSVTPSPEKKGRKNMRIRCILCQELAQRTWSECSGCGMRSHVACLAERFLKEDSALNSAQPRDRRTQPVCLPRQGSCANCQRVSTWTSILGTLKTSGWRKNGKSSQSPQKTIAVYGNDGHACDKEIPVQTPPGTIGRLSSETAPSIEQTLRSLSLDGRKSKRFENSRDSENLLQDTEYTESLASRLLRRLREGNGSEESSGPDTGTRSLYSASNHSIESCHGNENLPLQESDCREADDPMGMSPALHLTDAQRVPLRMRPSSKKQSSPNMIIDLRSPEKKDDLNDDNPHIVVIDLVE